MPAEWKRLLQRLSRNDLQKLLAAKAEIEDLEKRREALRKELASVEKSLARLVEGAAATPPGRKRVAKKKAAKKTTRKKTTRKKAAATKAAGKGRPAPKAGRRKRGGAAAVKKVGKPAAAGAGRPKLEDVVVEVLREHGGSLPFKDLMAAIVEGKRFESRSRNFDNVLRRTLSTSTRVKRQARGVYGL